MRRYFQFSLRTLFVLTTLAAVACAVGVPYVVRQIEHRNAKERRGEEYDDEAAQGVSSEWRAVLFKHPDH